MCCVSKHYEELNPASPTAPAAFHIVKTGSTAVVVLRTPGAPETAKRITISTDFDDLILPNPGGMHLDEEDVPVDADVFGIFST